MPLNQPLARRVVCDTAGYQQLLPMHAVTAANLPIVVRNQHVFVIVFHGAKNKHKPCPWTEPLFSQSHAGCLGTVS